MWAACFLSGFTPVRNMNCDSWRVGPCLLSLFNVQIVNLPEYIALSLSHLPSDFSFYSVSPFTNAVTSIKSCYLGHSHYKGKPNLV